MIVKRPPYIQFGRQGEDLLSGEKTSNKDTIDLFQNFVQQGLPFFILVHKGRVYLPNRASGCSQARKIRFFRMYYADPSDN